MRYALCVVAGLLASCSHVSTRHYVDVVNDSSDSVIALSGEAPGSETWKPLQLDGTFNGACLEGGYIGEAMVALPNGQGCMVDLLVEFVHRRALLISAVNVCKRNRLYLGRAWQQAMLHVT
ncbi:MAG: hypothetical protein ACTHNE_04065 [Dyella sp.]|uniref:hypothetical protein n=1 Tax=Dyella sp. TaxID=1869338 RepID=UPI003F7FB639